MRVRVGKGWSLADGQSWVSLPGESVISPHPPLFCPFSLMAALSLGVSPLPTPHVLMNSTKFGRIKNTKMESLCFCYFTSKDASWPTPMTLLRTKQEFKMDGWRTDGRMGGWWWTDGRTDGWRMDGWTDVSNTFKHLLASLSPLNILLVCWNTWWKKKKTLFFGKTHICHILSLTSGAGYRGNCITWLS